MRVVAEARPTDNNHSRAEYVNFMVLILIVLFNVRCSIFNAQCALIALIAVESQHSTAQYSTVQYLLIDLFASMESRYDYW